MDRGREGWGGQDGGHALWGQVEWLGLWVWLLLVPLPMTVPVTPVVLA